MKKIEELNLAKIVFPPNFLWGTATSAFQIEGAVSEDGKGQSIWDTFCHREGAIKQGQSADVACDHYHRFREDVRLMKQLGYKAYRFSFSWSRIFPKGEGEINYKGLQFYVDLVDELQRNGILAIGTLYHWDLPQALQDVGGWADKRTVRAFVRYSELIFDTFGEKISHYVTLNEPWDTVALGNITGGHAPGIQDIPTAINVSYNLYIAHGLTVQAFRKRNFSKSKIGITLNLCDIISASEECKDVEEARLMDEFMNKWYLDPLFLGKYPDELISFYKKMFPIERLSEQEMRVISEPIDFIGVNNYFSLKVKHNADNPPLFHALVHDKPQTDIGWDIDPDGMYRVIKRLSDEYGAKEIIVTENGAAYKDTEKNGSIDDQNRIDFIKSYLVQVKRAIDDGANVTGYFVWSFMDNFEWAQGYKPTFGLVSVDYGTQKRTPKKSAYWYGKVCSCGIVE